MLTHTKDSFSIPPSRHETRRILQKAIRLAKTTANATRPTVRAPLLRVFFLQGLLLFWGTALSVTLAGAGFGCFKLFAWGWKSLRM